MRLIGLVVALSLTLALLAAEAQENRSGTVSRVGHLSSLDKLTVNYAAFREKLRELGWIEGTNIIFEERFAGRDGKRLATFAAELAHLRVDLRSGINGYITYHCRRLFSSSR
jgi:putative tryptophan/tyrosine transport system substrate-binding protein